MLSRPRSRALAAPTAALAVLGMIAALIFVGASSAQAYSYPNCPPGYQPDPSTQTCIISVGTSTSAPPGSTGGGGGGGGGGGPVTCTVVGGPTVPCTSKQYGYWLASYSCYVQYANPQPPATDPSWQGHKPGDGSIWSLTCPIIDPQNAIIGWQTKLQWFQNPPVGANPVTLAQEAAKEMTMKAAALAFAPKRGSLALVGAPLWAWDQKSAQTWGPQTVTVSAGGLSVTATSKVTALAIAWRDGSSSSCADGGTPYQNGETGASPDCGHVYQATGSYTITATSTWTMTWTATNGQNGVMTFPLTATAPLTVGSAQAVIQGGSQ
jgi:hypothetical protein